MNQYVPSVGRIRYSPKRLGDYVSENWWLVVDCDPEIGRYYRHLFWLSTHKTYRPWRPKWREHISVCRNETPQNRSIWEAHAGKKVIFFYEPIPKTNGTYWWLDVQCELLLDIREELGLPRQPEYPLHLTFCRRGTDEDFEHQNFAL